MGAVVRLFLVAIVCLLYFMSVASELGAERDRSSRILARNARG
jgi:hypothetical protein